MAPVGKENQQVSLPFPKTPDKPAWKENISLAAGTLSSSKIPVLSKSGQPPEWRQSQSQPCSSKARTCKLAHANPVLDLAAGLPPRTPTREPLSDTQLTTSGCRNKGDVSHGKEVNSAEFVSDPEALASILSNTGLTHQMVSVAHKPSLAQRVPLKGKRACLTNIGVEMAKANQPTRTVEEDSSVSSLEAKQLSNAAGAELSTQSSVGRKEITGTSWKEEEFTPDPAAKASILLNIGLSHSAFGATSKVSLAQRVPLKDARKASVRCDSMQGEGPSLSQPRKTMYGRVSCRTTPGPKALETLEASGAQRTNTPFGRCSNAEWSPYGLARRVPITNSQSLVRT